MISTVASKHVQGRLSSVYVEVWARLYELEPDELTTIPELTKRVALDLKTIHRAVYHAENAHLIAVHEVSKPIVWRRRALPEPTTVEWMVTRKTRPAVAWHFLASLAKRGYLRLTPEGFVPER